MQGSSGDRLEPRGNGESSGYDDRGLVAYLEEGIKDNFGYAAFIYIPTLEEHLGRSFSDPPRDDQRASPSPRLL